MLYRVLLDPLFSTLFPPFHVSLWGYHRLYDPDGDGKTKLDHVQDMLQHCVYDKQLPFWAVLMDTWYATKDVMLFIERFGKITYWCK